MATQWMVTKASAADARANIEALVLTGDRAGALAAEREFYARVCMAIAIGACEDPRACAQEAAFAAISAGALHHGGG